VTCVVDSQPDNWFLVKFGNLLIAEYVRNLVIEVLVEVCLVGWVCWADLAEQVTAYCHRSETLFKQDRPHFKLFIGSYCDESTLFLDGLSLNVGGDDGGAWLKDGEVCLFLDLMDCLVFMTPDN
jgi:hypothetical protein